ncbi:hypothetical protein CYK89_01480 [Clostridium perfringens]|uniref:hypothetical protein n=1 Tax=Clostridium perfringens TaxID=1502 RepID=UPI000D70C18B|nr:hypothetical protein [Clostridium perfringens]PWX39036.1 hypothetical protein CYK90_11765 [Clostridium perfringens]PWX56949.1 hypothetical protein CYK89_01480 [Clostridium perfringens]
MKREVLFKKLNFMLNNKIYDYFFLNYQYKGDLNCSLVDVLGRNKEPQNKILFEPLKLDEDLILIVNLFFKIFSRLENKEEYINIINSKIKDFQVLFFTVDLKDFIKIIELIKYHNLESILEDTVNCNLYKIEKKLSFNNENEKYEIEFYNEGLKIYYNDKFLIGYYNGLNEKDLINRSSENDLFYKSNK